MNILVFSWRDPKHPMAGGAEQVMHEHMKGWIQANHNVTLFASYFPGAQREEVLDGVLVIRRGRQILEVQLRAIYWYLFVNRNSFSLIVDQFHGLPFFTPLYSRPKKLAVVQEVTREVWLKNHLPSPFNIIVGLIGYISEPLFFLLYKNVSFMTGSESAKNDLSSIGISPKNITVIPHGVKINAPSKLPPKNKNKTVVFLGAIAKDKGIEDALKAFAILDKKEAYTFWVIGKVGKVYKVEIEELVNALGLEGKVTFWGFVSEKKKFELLRKAHILLNPSIREGWGLVNIEANAMETPVVAYNSPGLIDSVINNKNGVICKTNTPLELAHEVEMLFSDRERLTSLQKNSKKWSTQFKWEESKKKSLALINKLS